MEINDECCCGARFAVAGGWADCASVHRDWLSAHKACREATTLHVDNGNEADREGPDPLDETAAISQRTGQYGDGWVRHDGGECPVHPKDIIEVAEGLDGSKSFGAAGDFEWGLYLWSDKITHYRPLRDSDGVPYCSAEGLESWAEYVATDEDGDPQQSSVKMGCSGEDLDGYWFRPLPGQRIEAPKQFANTRENWTETLRRVYRREDT